MVCRVAHEGRAGGAEKILILEHHWVGVLPKYERVNFINHHRPLSINYEPSLGSVLRSATTWAQKPCPEGVTFSGRSRSCVLAVTYKLM